MKSTWKYRSSPMKWKCESSTIINIKEARNRFSWLNSHLQLKKYNWLCLILQNTLGKESSWLWSVSSPLHHQSGSSVALIYKYKLDWWNSVTKKHSSTGEKGWTCRSFVFLFTSKVNWDKAFHLCASVTSHEKWEQN